MYDGSIGYTSITGRAALVMSETRVTYNTVYFNYASKNTTYAYLFAVTPGTHGQDVSYTFYNNGGLSTAVTNVTVALAL